MDSLLLFTLTISLMFTSGQCYSESKSCSSVNGKMICESQQSAGNVAGASSGAFSGPGGTYQNADAMTGNTYTQQSSSSRTSLGNMPPGGPNPAAFVGGFAFPFGAAPMFGGNSASSSGPSASDSANTGTSSTSFTSTSSSDGTGAAGAFAGGFAGPGVFVGPAVGGFAGSGVFAGEVPSPIGILIKSGDGSSVSSGSSVSNFANTGTTSTFIASGLHGEGASEFSGPSGGFVGSAAGGFAGLGSSGGISVGGLSPSFGVLSAFGDGSSVPPSTSFSESTSTDTVSTFATSGLDNINSGGFSEPSGGYAAGEFVGPFSGGFVGTASGGFPGFGVRGVFVGGNMPQGGGAAAFAGNPAMAFPFNFVFGGGFPFGRR